MKIIPVIDIKNGIAVAAKKGERDRYKPLNSVICKSSDPLKLAGFYKNSGFSRVYVAELDGILYSRPNTEILKKISEIIPVMADIGIKGKEDVELLKNVGNIGNIEIVLGTESMGSIDFLHEILILNENNKNNNFNSNNFILSIDIKNGKLLNNLNLELIEFIEKIDNKKIKNKIDKIIILDLSQVGTSEGPNIELCKTVIKELNKNSNKKNSNKKKIIYGGGIKDISDIQKLKNIGIYAVLIGTAIHSGKIKINDLKNLKEIEI